MDELNQKLQSELADAIKEYKVGEISQSLLDIHKLLRQKAEKQRDVLILQILHTFLGNLTCCEVPI